MKYLAASLHVLDRRGNLLTLTKYEVLDTEYIFNPIRGGWQDHRLGFNVMLKDSDGENRCRIGLIAGHHTVCVTEIDVLE